MNIFKQFFKSIYSPKDIATFRHQGIGKTVLYIFFLSLITTIPIFTYASSTMHQSLDDARYLLENELPDFEIRDGILYANNEPTIQKEDNVTIFIDDTGTISVHDVEKTTNGIALLKTSVVVHFLDRTDTLNYSNLGINQLKKSELVEIIDTMNASLPIILTIIFIFLYLLQAIGEFLKVFIVGLIGLILGNINKVKLNYGQTWKLSAYAITLPTVFFTIMNFFRATVPFSGFINWAITIIMLFLAIKEIHPSNES